MKKAGSKGFRLLPFSSGTVRTPQRGVGREVQELCHRKKSNRASEMERECGEGNGEWGWGSGWEGRKEGRKKKSP